MILNTMYARMPRRRYTLRCTEHDVPEGAENVMYPAPLNMLHPIVFRMRFMKDIVSENVIPLFSKRDSIICTMTIPIYMS